MYSSKRKLTKALFDDAPLQKLENIVEILDQCRIVILRFILQPKYLRYIYSDRALRLSVSYFFSFIFCSIFSIFRPDLLLFLGPLIYGFPHLISSYFYTIRPNNSGESFSNKFTFFASITFIFITIKLLFFYQKPIWGLVNGVPALILVLASFLFLIFKKRKLNSRSVVTLVSLCSIIYYGAWNYPLLFLSATLFGHNLVAFFLWIVKANSKRDRTVALIGSLAFILFNALVMMGLLDSLFPATINHEVLAANMRSTTWLLTPWTDELLIGQRGLCLYTLGLSLHYFIWLKAIPENIQKTQTPPSFRASLKKVEAEIGRHNIRAILITFFVLLTIWLYSFTIGSYIYFLLAGLHFWTEIIGFALPKEL